VALCSLKNSHIAIT